MYAIALLRYRRPLEEVLPVSDALLLRLPGDDALPALDRIRDEDPYTKAGMVQYELLPWAPNIGLEALEQL